MIWKNIHSLYLTFEEVQYTNNICFVIRRKESLDKLSPMDRLIQQSLYWPDGRRRKCSEASALKNTRTVTGHLLEALVDKYNDDHKLFGVCFLPHSLSDYISYFIHLPVVDSMHAFYSRIVHMN
jgi:hypothetical protein